MADKQPSAALRQATGVAGGNQPRDGVVWRPTDTSSEAADEEVKRPVPEEKSKPVIVSRVLVQTSIYTKEEVNAILDQRRPPSSHRRDALVATAIPSRGAVGPTR